MSWTYDFTNYPDLSGIRLLVFDTDPAEPIFSDAEINWAMQVESSGNIIVGLTGYSPAIPVRQIISHRRAAALLLRGLGAGRATQLILQVLDVKVDATKAAASLKSIADSYIEDEMNAGYFGVAEMVVNQFSMRERLQNQLYRLVA